MPIAEAQAKVIAQWVQLGPDGVASARVITDAACPAIVIDGVSAPMTVRAEPGSPFGNVPKSEFLVRSCEAALPASAQAATIGGKPLPVPKPNPHKIMIYGDTGCRLLGNVNQNCNDPEDWPFAKINAAAAAAKPDLVIHVGDYHYREGACPVNRSGCAGSPYGYGFDAWNADFFEPAAPLLAAAPWIMVRGNHEDCVRAGEGWFRFLDRAPMEASCRDFTGHFVAKMGDFGVIVVDGAAAADPKDNAAALADTLRRQFLDVVGKVPGETWIASHRPMNAMVLVGNGANARNVVDNKVQEQAFGPDMPPAVRMSVAGHVHFFQAIDFGGTRPPQLIVGTGGDELVRMEPMSMVGTQINGKTVTNSLTRLGFGYMIWERAGTDWAGTLYDVEAKPIDHCKLTGRSLGCGQ
jgi:predicted phosphodiesterase